MTNTAENLILDRFSDEALTQAEPTALLALAKELREQRTRTTAPAPVMPQSSPITGGSRKSLPMP